MQLTTTNQQNSTMKQSHLFSLTLVGLLLLSLCLLDSANKERHRLEHNNSSLSAQLHSLRTTLGAERKSAERLRMTIGELREFRAADAALIESLGIRLRHANALSSLHTLTRLDTLIATSADTLPYTADSLATTPTPQPSADTLYHPLPAIRWRDSWVELRIEPEMFGTRIELTSRDTLHQIIHRIPHRWWIFSWGTKAIRQELHNTNPHNHITWAEYIELEN